MRKVSHILEGKGGRVVSVPQEAPVLEVIRLMAEYHIGSVLVMRGGELMGIATERDYARKIALMERSSRTTAVRQVMTADLICVSPADTMEFCMELMTEKHIRHLPVLEDDRLVGLISIGDLVKNIIEDQKAMILQLESYIKGETY